MPSWPAWWHIGNPGPVSSSSSPTTCPNKRGGTQPHIDASMTTRLR